MLTLHKLPSVLELPDINTLEDVARMAAGCMQCPLHQGRTRSVFSDGNPQAQVMLIGEGPGQQEDLSGVPFVGRAGQLLDQILGSVGIDRQKDIYICNTVKCRPPQNRKPEQHEMGTCFQYLQAQLDIIRPKIILLAGATAMEDILGFSSGITRLRGQWFPTSYHGALAMPVFHPSYLLRNQSRAEGSPKWLTWQDIQAVRRKMDELGIPIHGTPSAAYLAKT